MATTNFAGLIPQQKQVWARDVWQSARDNAFFTQFESNDGNGVVHRFTDLTKTEKGEQAVFQLVSDLSSDGVIGDNEREGNEEALQNYSQVIKIDQISNSVRNKGKLSDQKSVVDFRTQAKDKLAYWLGNRYDELRFLTLSGIGYDRKTDGSLRDANSPFPALSFASDVSAPSAKRSLMWNGSALLPSNTASITSAYTISYKALTRLRAYAKSSYLKPLKSGGKEYYVVFMRPETIASLKNDADYKNAVVQLGASGGDKTPFFTGGLVTVDGLVIHEHNMVYNTSGAANGAKWGAGGAVNGTRTLLCGAQALGCADVGMPEWNEKEFDYNTQHGINVDKMFGLLKPRFYNSVLKSVEDFGVISLDHFLEQ